MEGDLSTGNQRIWISFEGFRVFVPFPFSLVFSYIFQKFHPYMLCCRYSKIWICTIFFFFDFLFFSFFFHPFRPWVVYSWRTPGWDNRQQDRVLCMAKHSQKKISNMVKRAVFRDVVWTIAHCTPLNFILATNQTGEVRGRPVLLCLTARVISE